MCCVAPPRCAKTHLHKGMKEITNEARSSMIENFNNCIDVHPMNKDGEPIINMIQWVKSTRVFRKSKKSGQQDIRNLLLMS